MNAEPPTQNVTVSDTASVHDINVIGEMRDLYAEQLVVRLGNVEQLIGLLDQRTNDGASVKLEGLRQPTRPVRFRDVFEMVDEPRQLMTTIVGNEAVALDTNLERLGAVDLTQQLYDLMPGLGGELLLSGADGLGRSIDVARLARFYLANGWSICVATEEGDAAMGADVIPPKRLLKRRVLYVIPDIHLRQGADPARSYVDRLLDFIDRTLKFTKPGYVHWLLSFDPEFSSAVGWTTDEQSLLARFEPRPLPGFTDAALGAALSALTAVRGVEFDPDISDPARLLVENSDRTLDTLIHNVDNSRAKMERLGPANWLPSRQESWRRRFRTVCGLKPAIDPGHAVEVFRMLQMLRQVGLPRRRTFVVELAARLGVADPEPALRRMSDTGLLRAQAGNIQAFSSQQMADTLESAGVEPALDPTSAAVLREAVSAVVDGGGAEADDLTTLAGGLWDRAPEEAERSATAAIDYGESGMVHVIRAGLRQETDRPAEALEDLAVATKQLGPNPGVDFLCGIAQMDLGESDEADRAFTSALHFPGLAEDFLRNVLIRRGIVRMFSDRPDDALVDFNRVIAQEPAEPATHYFRARAHWFKGNDEQALADLIEATELGYDEALARYWIGRMLLASGDTEGSERELTSALEAGCQEWRVHFFRAGARLQLQRFSDAVADFDRAVEEEPESASIHRLMGLARLAKGDFAAAMTDVDRAIQLGDEDGFTLTLRGWLRIQQGDARRAVEDLQRAIETGDDSEFVYRILAQACDDLGDHEMERAAFDRLIEMSPDEPQYYLGRAMAAMSLDDGLAASQDATRATDLGAEDPILFYIQGMTRMPDDPRGAEEHLTRALEGNEPMAAASVERGIARFMLDDCAGAIEDFDRAIEQGLDSIRVRYWRGRAAAVIGRTGEARDDFALAIDLGMDDAMVHHRLGLALLDLQEYEAAEDHLTRAIEVGGIELGPVLLGRASARVELQRLEEAVEDLTAAIDDGTNVQRTLRNRVGLLLSMERYEEALDDLDALENPDQGVLELRGQIGLCIGDYQAAVTAFDRCHASSAESVDLRHAAAVARLRSSGGVQARTALQEVADTCNDPVLQEIIRSELALHDGDFDGAPVRQQDPIVASSTSGALLAQMGLAELFALRFDRARAAYRRALDGGVVARSVQADLEFYLARHPERLTSAPAQEAVNWVRVTVDQRL